MAAGPRASRLADLAGPTPVATFLRDYCGRRFSHEGGTTRRFERLMSWDDLNRVLEDHRLPPPRLRLARDGTTVTEDRYTRSHTTEAGVTHAVIEPARLREELRAGATLVLDAVDQLHEPVRWLAAGLERELCERVQVDLHASWRERRSFGMRWDDHDLLVLQVAGRRRWRVHETTRPHPLEREAAPEEPSGAPVWDGFLEAGAVIHVPRGHWHEAMAGGEPSLHLTVGLIRPAGIDLLGWIADRLRAEELFRRDLPRRADPEERRAHARALREAVLARWPDDVLDVFFERQDAHAETRPRIGLPWGVVDERLDEGRLVRDNLPRPAPPRPHPDGVEVRARGRSWVFAAAAWPMLALALDGDTHPVGELLAAGDPDGREQRLELLTYLCRHDLLAVVG